jgi:hypothetical protein
MDFPTILYRCPGPHSRPGGTYALLPVADAQALAEAEQAGWRRTMPEAIEGKPAHKAESADDAPPTRAELEQRATEIGLRVDGRWSDARLSSEIAKVT